MCAMGVRRSLFALASIGSALVVVAACSAAGDSVASGGGAGGSGGADGGGGHAGDASVDVSKDGPSLGDVQIEPLGELPPADPCTAAAQKRSYVGCDYWPTVTENAVDATFDFTVVVANTDVQPANVTVTGPNGFSTTTTVAPNGLAKIYLPWVKELEGPTNGCSPFNLSSVVVPKGAYHLVSDRPVSAYQFNALEYKGAGGPAGKNWGTCVSCGTGCFSYTNDASLLLPTTALTATYRVMGWGTSDGAGAFFAVTATADGTDVTIKLSAKGFVTSGSGVTAAPPGGTMTLHLDRGDVAEITEDPSQSADVSGTLVVATKPVQVLTGHPCAVNGNGGCDHLESSMFPAETLGKHYLVTVPTGPEGNVVGHVVRIYGNIDGTQLTYAPSAPAGAPTTIDAVTGSQPFGVGSFMLGANDLGPNSEGDPSQSFAVAVDQYRPKYVFLAPNDYDASYADVTAPAGATLTLDAQPVTVSPTPIGASGWSVYRIALGPGQDGAHVLDATAPVGIQVIGYGKYTGYMYPGGSDLAPIAPPPVK
jgi:hypothetical protein